MRDPGKTGHLRGDEMDKPLTDWEAANELVAISDYMAERIADLRLSHPDVFNFVQELRLQIGDKFNRMNTHDFGIASHDMEGHKSGLQEEIR